MIIQSIDVKNFRCILDATLDCDMLTALVGPNGAGKSTFLRAIEFFYMGNPAFGAEDFYAEDVSTDIEISITFANLDAEERERFGSYVENGTLTVSRVLSLASGRSSAKYHGALLQNTDFVAVRAAGGKREITAAYNELRQDARYADELPSVRSGDAALENLRRWETSHPDRCVRRRDDGQFFGFTEVAQGYLGRYTRYIPVPAVRDASDDAAEGRNSAITQILDLVVRNVLAQRDDVMRLRTDTQARYDEILDPQRLMELRTLEGRLSSTLTTYVPDGCVELSWLPAKPLEIPLPTARVKLVEDGFSSTVERTGHGLQRAFILTLLQHLAVAVAPSPSAELKQQNQDRGAGLTPRIPNLILGIEEPELYQHPNRQRRLATVLMALSSGRIPGVAAQTQILYGTHSPLFVGIDRFDQIRLLRKTRNGEAMPKVARVARTSLQEVARALWEAKGRQGPEFTADTLRLRLQTIMTPWMNEGFFAGTVVLVEGENDRAAVLGFASAAGHDLEGMGISVIPCTGKSNLDRPLMIFRRFGLPVYLIWDSDQGSQDADPRENRYLLRLVGQPEEDWPAVVGKTFACFRTNIEDVLLSEIGDGVCRPLLDAAKTQFAIRKDGEALKKPTVVAQIVAGARKQGHTSTTMEDIVRQIVALGQQEVPA